jgi:allantoicase
VWPEPVWHEPAWREIILRTSLSPDTRHDFRDEVRAIGDVTHVRLNIYPDGGVARLRVHGEVAASALLRSKRLVDLAAARLGALVLGASDMHFGAKDNLIMPGRAANMGDGWETRRRRGPGLDWLILKLAAPGTVERIEVDTNHFKGNFPESCSLEGCHADGASLAALTADDAAWEEILPRTRLGPHRRHFFLTKKKSAGPFTHVRFRIYPDGGVTRLRLHGRPEAP